jgi:hypothetical protein
VPKLILAQVSFSKEYFIVNQQHPEKFIKNGSKLFICGAEYHNVNNHFNGFVLETNLNGDSVNYFSSNDTISNIFWDIAINDTLILLAGDRDSSATYADANYFIYSLTSRKRIKRINFGYANDGDIFLKILIDNENNIYLIGWVAMHSSSNGDVKVVKCDKWGNLIWKKNYGGSKIENGFNASFDSQNNIVISGNSYSFSSPSSISGNTWTDGYLLCIDTTGNMLWQKNYAYNNDNTLAETFQSISKTKTGFICADYLNDETIIQNDPNYNYEALLYMVNDTGKVLWQKRFLLI